MGNSIITEKPFDAGVADKNLIATKTVSTCEFNVQVTYDSVIEKYEFVNINLSSANFIEKRLSKSSLIDVKFSNAVQGKADEAVKAIMQTLFDEDLEKVTMTLAGGFDGTMANVNAGTFIGIDKDPSASTGIQSFLENNIVSIMAVPGVTDPSVLVSLVAHCEHMGNRMAVLDAPKDVVKVDELLEYRSIVDSSYAALYHPWIQIYDMLDRKQTNILTVWCCCRCLCSLRYSKRGTQSTGQRKYKLHRFKLLL